MSSELASKRCLCVSLGDTLHLSEPLMMCAHLQMETTHSLRDGAMGEQMSQHREEQAPGLVPGRA